MDLSLIDDQIEAMDDSFLVLRSGAMDEVSQILKKWKLNNPLPKNESKNINNLNQTGVFDSRTFTRPSKRRTFAINEPSISTTTVQTENEVPSMESGIASINLQVGGAMSLTPLSMQRSWLNDVSPPSSICTSMDFQNNETMLNSLITSSDFTNVSFLLNGNGGDTSKCPNKNSTMTIENFNMDDVTPTRNMARNLMDFTFDVNKTVTKEPITSSTFTADVDSPLKEYGIENLDFQLNDSTEDIGKNLTYNAYNEGGNLTWDKIQDHQNELNKTIVQSTPIHTQDDYVKSKIGFNDHTLSPISSFKMENSNENIDENDQVLIRNIKSRRLLNDITIENYRNSSEDHSEFLLNEETIKIGSRVRGETFECTDNLKSSLIASNEINEKEFDEMLDSFLVKKSAESEKLLQSVDNIKQRHSLINFEKQREEKQRKDNENDNKSQYEALNKSSERLLNRRSRLYDDVNLQLQKQQIETSNGNGSAKMNNVENECENSEEPEEVVDKNNRDRFKTIKLNKKPQNGMVVIDSDASETITGANNDDQSISPGTNKERRNQINQQQKQECDENVFKRPAPSGLSKFGFSRPTYRSRNDLNLPLKASSTDSLDNDLPRASDVGYQRKTSNLKSPMGIKSKSIHNLMFNNSHSNGMRLVSNLKLVPSQNNLKAPRASSLVRPTATDKAPQLFNGNQQQISQMRAPNNSRKTPLVRPSSGYYGNSLATKRYDSDTESGMNSLSSSSASSRNSVHLSVTSEHQQAYQQNSLQSTEDLRQSPRKISLTGTIPKPSGLRQPSNLRAPQARSGLPRPSGLTRK